MPKIILDARNLPSPINLQELVAGMQTLPVEINMIVDQNLGKMGKVQIISQSSLPEDVLENKDIYISLNPNLPVNELKLISQKGLVPLLHSNFQSLGFAPFMAVEEAGNSFLFENWNNWEVFAALVRCLENYQFPYDWSNIVTAVKNLEIEI
ncbi:MAG: hypothetical protein UR28_C0026G0022 [Candidatus Peregrinibacteria bacterium GW2011_GWF2_33_10]|nr:MAG: hypothetical protein UR28_C0026G0022 [Candidatus Peregrinibacteria bacterium GW2011_GWF2_33_10]OGJ44276.1 MAG: hypothetical protein A2263_05470 [Candidatus Peregrinibacteria bacterium RIFOXYA2_FULL_33_21]OGJ45095.1 MAG: hypothetical protein A2272_05965 [Candidatus Peregrinibacteria bacterium RIFOXYA12_FULL_33_12]OGJ50097.1 MAG: hypothetical protein A2307_01880 [Candidatus Peregrinibacteria bacterium RIFOXYB2_FULL_33_20]